MVLWYYIIVNDTSHTASRYIISITFDGFISPYLMTKVAMLI